MWLESKRQFDLVIYEPDNLVVPHIVNIRASSENGEAFTVGRILADELRRLAIWERGESVWEVADCDSDGLLTAYASLLDENRRFREEDFEGGADPVVYVYRFVLQPDFGRWKLAVMHAFCETFDSSAAILAQWHKWHTTYFTADDFERLAFHADGPPVSPDAETIQFMVRDNVMQSAFTVDDYPDDTLDATAEHQQWLEEQGPWDLC